MSTLSGEAVAVFASALTDEARERWREWLAPAVAFTAIIDLPDPGGVGEVKNALDTLDEPRHAGDDWSSADARMRLRAMHEIFASKPAVILAAYGAQRTTTSDADGAYRCSPELGVPATLAAEMLHAEGPRPQSFTARIRSVLYRVARAAVRDRGRDFRRLLQGAVVGRG